MQVMKSDNPVQQVNVLYPSLSCTPAVPAALHQSLIALHLYLQSFLGFGTTNDKLDFTCIFGFFKLMGTKKKSYKYKLPLSLTLSVGVLHNGFLDRRPPLD